MHLWKQPCNRFSIAGRIDVLVNNAGYSQAGAIEETSIADMQAQFDTNLLGVIRMIKAVLPTMRQQGRGRVINISSETHQAGSQAPHRHSNCSYFRPTWRK